MGKLSKETAESNVSQNGENKNLLWRSVQGATFLILLQVASRALTFIVNQILIRFLSPELVGISTQLELYSISVLYFSRESLRVALQRQTPANERAKNGVSKEEPATGDERSPSKQGGSSANKNSYLDAFSPAGKVQTLVNTSYLAVALGIPLAYIIATFYLQSDSAKVAYFSESLSLYGLATVIELLAEPGFVVAQEKMVFKIRASAETTATIARCFLACGLVVWASTNKHDIGVLPFAAGQLSYAMLLNITYYSKLYEASSREGFSFLPKPLASSEKSYLIMSYFSRPLCLLTGSLFIQSAVKYVLTQGDALLMVSLSSLQEQGAFALASNYGGLVARMLFQPIEESSRNLFSKLLSSSSPDSRSSTTKQPSTGVAGNQDASPSETHNPLRSAQSILNDILKLYLLLSLVACALGPTIAPLLLRLVAGSRWSSTSASSVLATYCYYIPLLALNGITEAFISSVATSKQLHAQSIWMCGFFVIFAGSSVFFMRFLQWGAEGLVWANAINMVMRIVWSWTFIQQYFRQNGESLDIKSVLPNGGSLAASVGAAAELKMLQERSFGGSLLEDLIKAAGVAGIMALSLAYFERHYLIHCYTLLRPKS
ncbi:Rft-1-domain-containing protein [Xylona heveae TC161]|uniref:Man(5)GlcNAc(2)-PP-dolichol translocation protein RFT1 n=1 Tax=Xylona heveae (strain CBS 132557 / TC161) TaxID=1328760 RepID=A0A165A937_XYLHT|nr:Rft-1-domain-containing protein [Xylona heveae TC161]KZF20114.1 Rft-1-domain-containing protein [Xylona heveae TC161]